MQRPHILRLALVGTCLAALSAHAATDGDRLKPKSLEKARTAVWAEWCSELKRTDTLAPLSHAPLAEGNHMAWTLPDTLEADAVMDFYSGVKGPHPAEGYPFFLYLHGSGPRDQEWATGLKLAQRFDDGPSMYAVPRIPNEGRLYRWWHQSKQWAWEQLLRRVLADPAVDPSRIYFFGISEGGYGSQRLASFYADYLAAAGPMAGGEPLRNAPAENLSHTPLSLITGDKDAMFYRNILTPRAGERLDSLEALYPGEYKHRVMLEKDHGHPVTYDLTTPWLTQFSRVAQPCHFRWENYEMDGRKRNAFYNLEVISESVPPVDGRSVTTLPAEDQDAALALRPLRTDYEFSVSDNVVRLDVREVEYVITETDPYYGIELNNTRRYRPAEHGQVRIYLSEQLVDLTQPVTLYVNGEKLGEYRPTLSKQTLRQSCRLFGDPLRLFPTVLEAKW